VIVGHEAAIKQIGNPLPQASLLLGPAGIGKSLVARHLAEQAGAKKMDLQVLSKFYVSDADQMIAHHSTRPFQSPVRVTVADISKASPQAINSVLKLLEEPPATSRIILHSDVTPLLTVLSRCERANFAPLSNPEVMQVLELNGYSEADAQEMSEHSRGSVAHAIHWGGMIESYAAVTSLCSALGRKDPEALNTSISAALKAKPGDNFVQTESRRRERCEALADAVSESLRGNADRPALSTVSGKHRLKCLRDLGDRARPALRYRRAAWTLAMGVGK
jgi:replication-associated recombination protein RarA